MELNELLVNRIEKEFNNLENLEPGAEKSETVDDICKLYKVYLEDNRMNNDYYDKQERRELDKDIHDDEMLLRDKDLNLKETQIREEYTARAKETAQTREQSERENDRERFKIITDVALAAAGMALGFAGCMITMNYEKSGSILGQTSRNLVQKCWKLWK